VFTILRKIILKIKVKFENITFFYRRQRNLLKNKKGNVQNWATKPKLNSTRKLFQGKKVEILLKNSLRYSQTNTEG